MGMDMDTDMATVMDMGMGMVTAITDVGTTDPYTMVSPPCDYFKTQNYK